MPAPSGIIWGPEVTSTVNNNAGRLGIYLTVSSSGVTSTVYVQVWFWSKYGVEDTYNTLYFNWNATYASTSVGNVSVNHPVSSGSGWSTSNQSQIYSSSRQYTRTSSNQTINVATRLSTIETIGREISFSASTTVPAIETHTVSYNANGGSGAPTSQTKVYGSVLILSTQVPTRPGYKFLGWGTSSTDRTPDYQPGSQYGVDADITLYAIWEVVELINFTINSAILTIPSNSSRSKANVPSDTLTVSTSGTSAVANTNYYVRARRLDGTVISTLGPYRRSSTQTVTVTISSSHILDAIQTQRNESQIQFQMQLCTGSNSFDSIMTTTKIATIQLNNFSFLRITSAIAYRDRNNSNINTFRIGLSYASSYNSMTGLIPTIQCDNISKIYNSSNLRKNILGSTTTRNVIEESAEYIAAADSPTVNSIVRISVTDGISTAEVTTSMAGTTENTDIYIFKSDNHCEAMEFIESDDQKGFDAYGNVYAHEFIESSAGVFINQDMEFGELVERNIDYAT